ncbi:MAG: C39 family peptidase [Anaerolineae bacterium]|nr:C39 family peptidase [Anaerolineae bacterium]
MRLLIVALAILMLALAPPVAAGGPSESPPQLYLPARHFWQTQNNCGPTAVAMAASVFGIDVDPQVARWALRPEPDSVGMDASRVDTYVRQLGLAARPRVNGTPDLLRRLLAADVPVLVNQWLTSSQRIEHYRLVLGYDTVARGFYVHDSTYGPYRWVSEADFMALWIPTGRPYVPIYRPNQESAVAAIIGQDWDTPTMYGHAYGRAVDDVWAAPSDAWAWARLGSFAFASGDAATALTAWRAARALGLPQGELWLPGWLAAAALDEGDYAAALGYADQALRRYPAWPGLHYVRGAALLGLGRSAEAAAALRHALELEPSNSAARNMLEGASR